MKVAITGGTGLIGRALQDALRERGHDPVVVTRHPERHEGAISWDPARGEIDSTALADVDAVVNLAGESIGSSRWTDDQKQRIVESRTRGTALLCEALVGLDRRPSVLITGSAIGYYGDRGDETLHEGSASGDDFLADVCRRWEASAQMAVDAGIRTCIVRTGIVLSTEDGALARQLLPFKLGLGGRIGSGRQWQSWITIDDHVAALCHLLAHDVEGPVNLVAPRPVRNADFADALGRVLHRPTVLPIPTFAPALLYGRELVDALLLSSQRVEPDVLVGSGFEFRHPELEPALRAVLGRPAPSDVGAVAGDRQVSVTRTISAPAADIFAVLADASQHPRIDGSGTVRASRSTDPEPLRMGSKFGMDMKLGVPYRISNEVVEYVPDRLIAWSHFGRHRWRYELEPVDGGTVVTETFDWSNAVSRRYIEWLGWPERHAPAMVATLERLDEVVTT
jgi:uncharacterized protein (TIGR01777 family)